VLLVLSQIGPFTTSKENFVNHRNHNLITANAGIWLLLASAALTLVAVLSPTAIADSKASGIGNLELSSRQSVVSPATI